jgi:hypothetical protein
MAVVDFEDLIKAIKNDPKYFTDWIKDVRAETALRIHFGPAVPPTSSEVFPIANGSELVITTGKDGSVASIEIT